MLVLCLYEHMGRDLVDDPVLWTGGKVIDIPYLSYDNLTLGFKEALAADFKAWGGEHPSCRPPLRPKLIGYITQDGSYVA